MNKSEEFPSNKGPEEENIEDLIPLKYKDLPSDVLEEIWIIPEYTEEGKTEKEKERKEKALEVLRKIEAGKKIMDKKPVNQTAEDTKKAFEGLIEGFDRGRLKKLKEYDERIRAVLAGNPIKNYDKEEDLKKDFKQLSGVDWDEDFTIDKL